MSGSDRGKGMDDLFGAVVSKLVVPVAVAVAVVETVTEAAAVVE